MTWAENSAADRCRRSGGGPGDFHRFGGGAVQGGDDVCGSRLDVVDRSGQRLDRNVEGSHAIAGGAASLRRPREDRHIPTSGPMLKSCPNGKSSHSREFEIVCCEAESLSFCGG